MATAFAFPTTAPTTPPAGVSVLSGFACTRNVAPTGPAWVRHAVGGEVEAPELVAVERKSRSKGKSSAGSSSGRYAPKVMRGPYLGTSSSERGMENNDPYQVLQLANGWKSTLEEIEASFRELVVVTHPDKNGGLGDDPFVAVQEAHALLTDPVLRNQFDSQYCVDDSVPKPEAVNADNFFQLFGPLFEANARWSKAQPVPLLGDDSMPYDDVDEMYEFWTRLESVREFDYFAEHSAAEIRGASDREDRRWMQQKNATHTKKLKKKDNQRIIELVQLAKKKDPRLQRRRAERKAAKEAAKEAKRAAIQAEKDAEAAEAARIAAEAEAARAASRNKTKNVSKRRKQARRGLRKLPDRGADAAKIEAICALQDPDVLEAFLDQFTAIADDAALAAAVDAAEA